MADIDLHSICANLIRIAKQGVKVVVSAKPDSSTISNKKNTADIVTQTDKAIENFISDHLTTQYPTFAFIGEETYKAGVPLTPQPTIIVDPSMEHPTLCIPSQRPFRDELWHAIKGHGAFTQQGSNAKVRRLPITTPLPLRGLGPACISIEWGSDREGPNFEMNLKVFKALARTAATGGNFSNSLRCTGSAVITICRVAAGQQDAFWECGSWAWDVAAAWCVLVKAGGVMVDGHPGVWNPPVDNRRYLVVRPAMEGQREFVGEFGEIIGEDRPTYGPLEQVIRFMFFTILNELERLYLM